VIRAGTAALSVDGLMDFCSSGHGTFAVSGDMTLRGTTKELTYTATIDEANDVIHSTATIEFSRWDFGLYPSDATGPGDDGVGDTVVVDYDVKLKLEESS
jgi:polyisoprenoid-binding protein YceI